MASNTVEQIFVELLLNAKGYSKDADDAIRKNDKLEGGLRKTEKQSAATNKSLTSLVGGIGKVIKGVAGLAAVIAAGTGLLKLADEARQANDELNFLSKNLGMSSRDVKAWQGAAAAMGGSASGMANDMKALNSTMNDFTMTGESSMLPMFNALGVSMVDAQGKVRDTDKVMLDLADSMSKMNREQAVLMGQKMGFDEGTINTLLQGRDAMKEMVDYHKQMYSSSKEELEASRQLSENQAKLSAHWESMKLMMGNAIIPLLVKLSDIALRFFEFLQKHQKTVKNVFEGMGILLGMLVIPILGKALVALLAFIAPFAPFILVVSALSAAFLLLYDDYKTWAEGGKSLFDWGVFSGYIDNAKFSAENLGKGFLYLLGDYKTWAEVAEDGKSWLKLKGFMDENGVSLKTLREGFINLAADIVRFAIPTLKEYAEIFGKLVSGDFSGAAIQAKNMYMNYIDNLVDAGKAIWARATGAVDVATGQQVGTLSNSIGGTMPSNPSTAPSIAPLKNTNDAPSKFIAQYWGMAVDIGKKLDVPPELIIAQLAEETGWGKSPVGDFNLGNIKAGANWKGPTKRGYDRIEKSWANYRSYASPEEFGQDYYKVVGTQKNFASVRGSRTPQEFFGRLKNSGYATDDNYVKKNLDVYDSVMRRLKPSQSSGSSVIQSASKKTAAAADYAVSHALNESTGKCAKAVNDSLRSQGISIQGHGKDVATNLIKSSQGFTSVAYDENYKPQIGDVMSMGTYSAAHKAQQLKKYGVEAGHVAIYTSKGWVSDFKQGEKYGNTGAANAEYYKAIKAGTLKPTIARKQDGANYTSSNLSIGAAQAYQSVTQGNYADLRNLTASAGGRAGNQVDVKIGDVKVYTTASTVTGVTNDAMNAAQNSWMQLTGSMA